MRILFFIIVALFPFAEVAEGTPRDYEHSIEISLNEPHSETISVKREVKYFTVSPANPEDQSRYTLSFETVPAIQLRVCFLHPNLKSEDCLEGEEAVAIENLGFRGAPLYFRVIPRDRKEAQYTLEFQKQETTELLEREPNNSIASAYTFDAGQQLEGAVSKSNSDILIFESAGEPQLWRVQVMGASIRSLALLDAEGGVISKRQSYSTEQDRLRLDSLYLSSGKHLLELKGEGAYILRTIPLGPPPASVEREPNDTGDQAIYLPFGKRKEGVIATTDDVDYYRFALPGPQRVRLAFQNPPDGILYVKLNRYRHEFTSLRPKVGGESLMYDAFLPAGDYGIRVYAQTPSVAEYELTLNRENPFEDLVEREPNDALYQATSIPALNRTSLTGSLYSKTQDYFYLPPGEKAGRVSVKLIGEVKLARQYSDNYSKVKRLTYDRKSKIWEGELPAEEGLYLEVENAYQTERTYTLEIAREQFEERAEELPTITLSDTSEHPPFAAYSRFQQSSTGTVAVTNNSGVDATVKLHAQATTALLDVALSKSQISVGAGVTAEVPYTLRLARDHSGSDEEQIYFAASVGGHTVARQDSTVSIECGVSPRNPVAIGNAPEELQGGINVAMTGFGATLHGDPAVLGSKPEQLFDGYTTNYGGWETHSNMTGEKVRIIVDLAGEEAVPVAGFALSRLGRSFPKMRNGYPVKASFLLGDSPDSLAVVKEEQVRGILTEQFFVLEKAIEARFAAIELDLQRPSWRLGFGEFKVIASPSFHTDEAENILKPEFGGHVVWSSPDFGGYQRELLLPSDRQRRVTLRADDSAQWVVGFQHSRRALVKSLSVRTVTPPHSNVNPLPTLLVHTSIGSATGPWVKVGELKPSNDGSYSSLTLDKSIWARYIRFEILPDVSNRTFILPTHIAATEDRFSSDGVLIGSVVGEWGHYSSDGPYEATHPPAVEQAEAATTQTDTVLQPRVPVYGKVARPTGSHLYTYAVSADQNYLRLTLESEQAQLIARRADGGLLDLKTVKEGNTTSFESYVEPGSTVTIEVYEPKRSVAFVWDTSGSVSPFRPLIRKTIQSFAAQVRPDIEEVSLVPFGQSPLLDDWASDPEVLRTAINDFRRDNQSSDVYDGLLRALRSHAGRPGKPSILVLTDAISPTGHRTEFWKAAGNIQPRVFAVSVIDTLSSQDPGVETDRMQDFAHVNNGFFQHLDSVDAYERVFEKATCLARRPVAYSLSAESIAAKEPEPGYLQVEVAPNAIPVSGAVEIILDASGSMLQRLKGERRISIARKIVAQLVRESIPEEIPVAFRVFGHVKPDSCDTELLIPPTAHEREGLLKVIQGVQAKNLAKTPIAASLEAVSSDLKGVAGAKNVVIITDGEETCEGDPRAAITALRNAGIDIRVNIVGFAVLDEGLQRQFETWANLAGGSYFPAHTQQELQSAVQDALKPRFVVLDKEGKEVAAGVSGDEALSLPIGKYRVIVGSGVEARIETAQIVSSETSVVTFR